MRKLILMLVVIAAILSGCDKYEQQCEKIYGQYTLKTYRVDGIDSLSFYKTILGDQYYFNYFEDEAFHYLRIDGYRTDGQWGGDINCRWQLINDYKIFKIYATYGINGTGPFGKDKISEWEIISLKKDEFYLKTIYGGKEYYIELN
ncbi:MAG TPA: hypothetical protein PKI01_04060 [Bacteroidales bacterium]|nr:hypothetical protein [Bacteroidales bacterium]